MRKKFWFQSRRVRVGLRSFEGFFLRGAIFFVFPWVKDDFGWTNLQVQLFFYISLTESSGNDNYYSKHDFEKSRKHSYIMRNTTRLTGFITKKPGLNSNRHPLQRKDGLVNDCEGGNIYFNMTFPCLTWIISKFWLAKLLNSLWNCGNWTHTRIGVLEAVFFKGISD